jgi:spore coat polysaccharide biosynthesis protein SpsF (cytidylyltransferase family)
MYETIGIVDFNGFSAISTAQDRWRSLAKRPLAGQPLAAWPLRRLSEALGLDHIVAIVPPESRDLEAMIPSDIEVVVCDKRDALGRLVRTIREIPAQSFVRAEMNCPFIDPVLIDAIIRIAHSHRDCDYASYCLQDRQPAQRSQVGLFAEWCTSAAIVRADTDCQDAVHRRLVTSFIYSNPQQFRTRLVPVPEALDRNDVRLTLQTCADLENFEDILESLGPDHLEWQTIVELLEMHPALRQRMESLNRSS